MNPNFKNWHKSSYSGGAGEDCIEKGFDATANVVGVRDTKRAEESPVLAFSGTAWTAFVADAVRSNIG
ncbi:DUF397 domain-containing protein [Streptomyces sp. NBC_01242]|uniref:DUF397 domain-containing protein n=1 Tax=Streptomyces sp. NBC_01242 TaxID=2903795 RepID=UPI002257A8F0|nr:DUF397 domain-containing protein [Streptomyces sp. NBC_01242]MCX4799647.1 DUF397 domain-containing protein [Streptomyces sp. NBC_01242]